MGRPFFIGVSAKRVGALRDLFKWLLSLRFFRGGCPWLHHDFRRFLDALDRLNSAQVEEAQPKIRNLRRKTEVISKIEAWTNKNASAPSEATSGARNGAAHGPGSSATNAQVARRPISAALAAHLAAFIVRTCSWWRCGICWASQRRSRCASSRRLRLEKCRVRRSRILVFSIIGNSSVAASFSGIIEADEICQRESRKDSRGWVRHFANPKNAASPLRPKWEEYTTKGLKMMRGLSTAPYPRGR